MRPLMILPQILVLSETHITYDITDNEISIKNYCCVISKLNKESIYQIILAQNICEIHTNAFNPKINSCLKKGLQSTWCNSILQTQYIYNIIFSSFHAVQKIEPL